MTPTEDTPSRNEEEYFARENAAAVKALRARLDDERRSADAQAPAMRCPRCGGTLEERVHQQTKIDVCADCGGIWLDKGELEILQRVDGGGVRRYFNDLFGARA